MPDYESTTVLLLVVSHLMLTPFILSQKLRVALPALALLALCAGLLMATRNMNFMVYTHYVPGLSLLVVGRGVFAGDGGPVITRSMVGPVLIFFNEAVTSQILAIRVYTPNFYSLSHNLLHFVAAVWMMSLLSDHICARWWPYRLPSLRLARAVYDPFVMIALGIMMIGHQHDTTPLGEFFHDTWGILFVAMGLLHVVSSIVHQVTHRDAPLAVLARAFHAAAWMYNGLWACLMGVWLNVWGDGQENGRFQYKEGSGRWTGAREVIFPAIGQQLPSGFEEGMALLSFCFWITGLLIAIELFMLHNNKRYAAPTMMAGGGGADITTEMDRNIPVHEALKCHDHDRGHPLDGKA